MLNANMISTLLLSVLVLTVAIAGYRQTEVVQPQELQDIEQAKEVHRLNQLLQEDLFAQEAESSERAAEMTRKWQARYKYIPTRMETHDVVNYLESLSTGGFEQFSVSLKSQGSTKDFNYYFFDIKGTAYYPSLYQFVWKLENNRNFYQIDNLQLTYTDVFKKNDDTGLQRRLEMVNFSMQMKAFFAGVDGLSAPQEVLVEIPDVLFPRSTPYHNSFYPLVRPDLPPNDELLVELDKADLVSIVGNRAIFQDSRGQFVLGEGDPVYLGRITKIDPLNIVVRARLNKGGIEEIVEKRIEVGDELLHSMREKPEDSRIVPVNPDGR